MANNDIKIRITAENQEFVSKMQEVVSTIKSISSKNSQIKPPDALSEGLSKITIIGFGVVEVLEKIKKLTESLVGTGLKYNKQMETAKLGIAGILMFMTTLNGKQLQLNQAMKISDNLLKKIQTSAAKIGLPADEMMSAFQSIIGPGLSAKMTLEELVEFVPTATKAVKTMLGSMADEMQVSQELRSMVSGDINMDSQVSKALGITKEGVAEAKQNAGVLFKYLTEKMAGFKEIAVEWPKTMTGAQEKFKASYAQASGNAFEKVFDKAKDKLNELTDALFVVNKETKLVEFKPELLEDLQAIVDNTILLAEKIIKAGNTIIPYLGTPLQAIGNLLKFIIDHIYGVTTAIGTWVVIQKAIKLMEILKVKVAAAKAELMALKSASVGAMTATTKGAGKAVIAVGKLETALFAVKTAIRGLASATLWGAIAVAAGYAVEEVMKLIDNINRRTENKKTDYFKEKESMNRPLPEMLEGKLGKPRYSVNPEVNTSSMKSDAFLKLEKYIAAINYMFPDKSVTITSGYRKWGGHTSGEKADIAVEGFENPAFRNQLINLAKEFGITVLDEIKAPASSSPEALANWGPHLDLNLGGNSDYSANADDLKIKEQQDDENAKAIANAKINLVKAIADGKLQEYLSELQQQEQSLENRYNNTKAGIHPDGENDISESDYSLKKKSLAVEKAMAEIENLKQQLSGKNAMLSEVKLTDAEKINVQADIKKIEADIAVKKKNLDTVIKGLDNTAFQAQKALEDQANNIKNDNLENYGNLVEATKNRLEKQNRGLREIFKANGMTDALKILKENENYEINKARFTQTQQDIEYANNDLARYQEKLLESVSDSSKSAKEIVQLYIDKFHELTDNKLIDLKSQLEAALKSNDKSSIDKIRAAIKDLKKSLLTSLENIIKAYENELQMQLAEINANRKMTSRQKQDAIDDAQRRKYAAEAEGFRSDAENLRLINKDGKFTSNIQQLEREAALKEKLAEIPTLLDDIHRASTQAFEDGLLDFLERGIFECKSLGDAFRNLAITILQSIQKVYAEAMTKNIMQALGLGSSYSPPSGGNSSGGSFNFKSNFVGIDYGFAEGGKVQGPGTETSDSILAKLSRGEFVINAAAVKKIGLNTLERINSGDIYNLHIPIPKFATGGYVGQVGARGASKGMESFTAQIGTEVSPRINVNNYVDGQRIFDAYGKPLIRSEAKKELIENMKMYNQLSKRFW